MKVKGEMMQWIQSNWVWIAFGAAFIGMHLFMHGEHNHLGSAKTDKTAPDESPKANDEKLHNHEG